MKLRRTYLREVNPRLVLRQPLEQLCCIWCCICCPPQPVFLPVIVDQVWLKNLLVTNLNTQNNPPYLSCSLPGQNCRRFPPTKMSWWFWQKKQIRNWLCTSGQTFRSFVSESKATQLVSPGMSHEDGLDEPNLKKTIELIIEFQMISKSVLVYRNPRLSISSSICHEGCRHYWLECLERKWLIVLEKLWIYKFVNLPTLPKLSMAVLTIFSPSSTESKEYKLRNFFLQNHYTHCNWQQLCHQVGESLAQHYRQRNSAHLHLGYRQDRSLENRGCLGSTLDHLDHLPTMEAPREASSSAYSRPKPRAAPVMIATWPEYWRCSLLVIVLCWCCVSNLNKSSLSTNGCCCCSQVMLTSAGGREMLARLA